MGLRRCSRTGCNATAIATLTYAYAESTAVLGPLALRSEPGAYDLCLPHTEALSAPRGWEVIRLPLDNDGPRHSSDDLLALADAVREAALGPGERSSPRPSTYPSTMVELGRRGHLTVLADPESGAR